MKCPLCRAPVRAVDKYCPYCKRLLPGVEVPQPPEPSVAAPPSAPEVPASSTVSGFDALVQFGTQTWGGEPTWFAASGLVSRVGAWRTGRGWRLLTFGNSTLDVAPWRYELSGRGFELTCEVSGDEVPEWLPDLLSRVSGDAALIDEAEALDDGHTLSPEGLPALETDNGRVTLLRVSPPDAEVFTVASRVLSPEEQLLVLARSLARPAVVLRSTPDETSSCIGGQAPVGDAFVWPRVGGQALPLLLNLDLSEVPGDPLLPTTGRLLVFGPPDSDTFQGQGPTASYQVRYLERALAPRTVGELLPVEGLRFEPHSALPPRHVLRDARELEALDEDVREDLLETYAPEQPMHTLLGWSHPYQDDVCLEALCVMRDVRFPLADELLAELRAEAAEWLQLLTLRSGGDWSFAGDGRLYLVIRRDDLAARRFERCRCVIQR